MRFRSSNVGCCLTDEHRTILSVDDAYSELAQRPKSELLGLDCLSFTAEHDLDRNDQLLTTLQKGGAPFAIVKHYVRPDLSMVEVHNHVSVFRDGLGPDRLMATCEPLGPPEVEQDLQRNRITAHQLGRALTLGKGAFGSDLLSAPAAEILLLLYLAEVEGGAVALPDIIESTMLSPKVAQRWIEVLIGRGHAEREVGAAPLYREPEAIRISASALARFDALLGATVSLRD